MTNRQRFPLLLAGKRVMLDASVDVSGGVQYARVYFDHRVVLPATPVPAAGMTVPVPLPDGRIVTIVFGPAKAHYVSLAF